MREILFRGKKIKDGTWIEGGFCYGSNRNESIICPKHDFSQEVIPETVGQYTGLTDKNGKKIFEGDIVLDRFTKISSDVAEVKFCTEDVASCGCCYEYFSGSGFKANGIRLDECEVIGNIHDNPELLKGE